MVAGDELLLECYDGTIRSLTGKSIENAVAGRGIRLAEEMVAAIASPKVCVAGSVSIASLDVSPDSQTIAVGEYAGGVCLYNRRSGEFLRRIRDSAGDLNDAVLDILYSDDGTLLAFASGDYVMIVETDSGRERLSHFDGNGHLQFFDNDRLLAICQGIQIWRSSTFKAARLCERFPAPTLMRWI